MSLKVIEDNESSVRGYSRAFPAVFAKSIGSIIYDKTGREYIDFFSGAGGLNYGHNHPIIKQAMIDYIQGDGIIHGLDMATVAKTNFISVFKEYILNPRKLDYRLQFTGPTGTNSVEAALKLARLVTKRSNVVAFTHGFHGVSVGSLATTANSWFRNASGIELNNVTFVPYDGYIDGFDSINYLTKMLNDPSSGFDMPAAVILEAIQGEGGVNVASPDWLQRLRKLTSDLGIILIVDDIQAGCGRSGDFFSFEKSGIVPDFVTLSKSLSASGLPMSLLLIKPEYDIWKPGQHNGTFRGNNLAFISAERAIREFWTNNKLSSSMKLKEKIISDRLNAIAKTYLKNNLSVRGRGMFYGLVFDKAEDAQKVARHAFEEGLIIELCGSYDEVLKLLPALNIDNKLLIRGLDIIEDSIKTL